MIHLGSISAVHQIKHNSGHLQNGSVSLYICNHPPTIPGSSNCTRTATWLCAHPILSMSAGSPFDTHVPVGLQCSGFTHMTCTHPAPYSLLLVQKVHWAHAGTPGCGSQHVSPCSVTPLAGAAYAIPRGGDSSRSRRRWGWQWSNFWQCHVEVGLLFCYHFSIPRCLLHHKMSCYFILLVKLIPFLKSPFAILWLLFNLLDGNFTQRLSSIITSLGVSGLGQHCLRISSLGYSIDTWLKPAFLSIVLVHCYPGHVNKKIPPQQLI